MKRKIKEMNSVCAKDKMRDKTDAQKGAENKILHTSISVYF